MLCVDIITPRPVIKLKLPFARRTGTNQSIMQNYKMADAPYMGDVNTNFDRTFRTESSGQYAMGMEMVSNILSKSKMFHYTQPLPLL